MAQIKSFNSIEIKTNTLVLCDIDDTIFKFPEIDRQWWKDKFDYYYNLNSDYDSADLLSLQDWIVHITNNEPEYTDGNGFLNMVSQITQTKSKLIFITARSIELEPVTHSNFTFLGFDPSGYTIHHVGYKSKGDFIKKKINYEPYDQIIFIDDRNTNIQDVIKEIQSEKLVCYQFV